MTTGVAEPPLKAAAAPLAAHEKKLLSPVEHVKGLPAEDKEDILIALVREMIEINGGDGLIPIETLDGESLGYYVPPAAAKARYERLIADIPAIVREQLIKPLPLNFDPDDVLSDKELLELRRQGDRSARP